MKNTKFVSAGAGSGKTYSLTQDIAKMIIDGECRAEEIILTTFTEAAAKELREKVRSTLYSKGLYEAAMNIDNAAIGTIHSIAYQFVSRYWYLLGISANVSIMDTEGSKFCISQSLASLPTEEDLWLFDTMCRSFNLLQYQSSQLDFGFWKKELKDIIDKTVELCISEKQLKEAKKESKKLLEEVIKWKDFDITSDILARIKVSLTGIFNAIADNAKKDKEAKRKELLDSLNALNYDGEIGHLPISKLHSLLKNNVAEPKGYLLENLPDDVNYLQDKYENIPASKQVRDLVERYIDAIFRLAIQWKKEYEEFKRKRCLLDFGDLLQKFDELLDNKEVVADIQSRYKVAFVDEFQDCSPLQVKSFERLSELMEQSVWVGDVKQAIYGFRGTNTERIKSIIDEVKLEKDGNKLHPLECSWRSNETIVNLVNNIFCEKVFRGQLPKELIELGMPKRTENDPPKPQERELRHVHLETKKSADDYYLIADLIAEQIDNGTYRANEIAVLFRDKYGVQDCAEALRKRGIAYNARFDNYTDDEKSTDDVSSFICAVVSFAARGDNELSKAIIANRIEAGCSIPELIANRLQNIESEAKGKNWLSDLHIIGRIADIRKAIGNQSVSAAVETLVVELNLADLIKRIDPSVPAYNYCSALEAKATTYEGICANFGMSSTLVGFVDYLKQHPIEYPGDDNGVSVMTYHKSKGLEWPCVILCSLHKAPVVVDKTFFGVLTRNTAMDTSLRLIPSAIKDICSSIMHRFEANNFFQDISCATINEAKRLMYVGMTRPKEQLVLTTLKPRGKDSKNNPAQWLLDIGCESIESHSNATKIKWGGSEWNHSVQNYIAPNDTESSIDEKVEFNVLKLPTECSTFENKFISPSKVESATDIYNTKLIANFAERMQIRAVDGKDNTIGNFIHHVMCLWNGDKGIIETLAKAYGVRVDIDAVVTSITDFWKWMEKTYGKATQVDRELPFSFVNESGQLVTGEIDLVYCTAEGDVLVDYKTYQGSPAHLTDENNDFHAGKKYGSQITLYEEALKRRGSVVRGRLICYLSLGVIIGMK
ncbi:MAG: UvrD-helicase domain-containing protein [Bacteroidaceae bacterium]|nr:UvrD-helicase domain-containing protein [Bacteroidaceae bacterium]